MIAVHAKWKDGRVVVDEAVDWPDGCELEVRPNAGVVPIAPAPSPMYWPVPIPAPSNFQPNAFQVTTDQATDDEPSEVIVEPDDAEQYEPSPEETEAAAQTLLSDAKQLAAEGNRRKAVEILKAIVTECPHTQAAL